MILHSPLAASTFAVPGRITRRRGDAALGPAAVGRRPILSGVEQPPRVVLVGMMGSGKTTVGQALAARTGWPYVDNDELLDRLVGATPKQILAEHGEAQLRVSESAALMLGLDTPPPAIIGAAAGTILDPENRSALRERGVVVWLRAGPETLAARSIGAAHRAWLDEGGDTWIRETVAERYPLYASVADMTLDVEGHAPADLAREIEAGIGVPG
jgi:shikimate kinase